MLCLTRNNFKLFPELSPMECGLVSNSSVTTTDELVEAACLLKETALTMVREDKKPSGSVKCFTCQKPGLKCFDCPD